MLLQSSMALPEITIASDGGYHFSLPLTEARLTRYQGATICVRVDGVAFPVTINRSIPLPLPCQSLQEAKYFAAAISLQVVSATAEESSLVESAAASLPDSESRFTASSNASGPRILDTFELWRAHHLALDGAPTTPPYWHLLISRFVDHLGHDELATVSAQDVRDYRDHLIRSGRNIRTARHADFAAIRALFHFAVEQQILASDPTQGIRFKLARLATQSRMLAFSDDQARTILQAADRQSIASRRWIPWLTAFTGSRVATIANLRTSDVVEIEGCWALRISRQAGPIKTAASERLVPIHPAILSRGFIDFVERLERDRLFFAPAPMDAFKPSLSNPLDPGSLARYNPARSTIRRVTEWLHTLGLEIGREHKRDPNHAWRHWFKEKAFAAGVPEKIADAIVGHAQATTARRYGSVALKVMAAEMQKIQSPA